MKKDWTKRMLKNGLMAVFALAMICCGMSFLGMEGNEVHAAEAAVANEEGYVVKQYDDISTYKTNSSYPILSADEYLDAQDWLFAGWYTTEACNTSIGTTATGGAWAKFVHVDVLSVKCQIETGTDEETLSTNMRLISTIDSLAYDTVGFKVRYNGGKELDFSVSTVFKRINASEENGNECGYSPAAFHNTSEYFMTYSLLDIKNQNFSKSFYIEPYWITLDGTEVSGASRFARVEDQYLEIVNVPVRLHQDAKVTGGSATVSYNIVDSDETAIYEPYTVNDVIQYDNGTVFDAVTVEANTEAKTVTVTASEQSESVAENGLLVNLRFKMIADGMPSLSEFAITSDEFAVSNFIFRNFPLTYDGGWDVSWYTGYENSDTFSIASADDLYGLAKLANGDETNGIEAVDFSGKTIYLASDITINTLAEGETTANWATTAPTHSWTPIGASTAFAGTFDGQGNSIRGLYAKNETDGESSAYKPIGLFGEMSGDIQNLKLKDSFVANSRKYVNMGSIVGKMTGNMSNVYSDAYVTNSNNTGAYSGGLIGRFVGSSVSDCWYEGTLSGRRYVGGIAALVDNSTTKDVRNIQNCLVGGSVGSTYTSTSAAAYCGGLVGQANKVETFNVANCLVAANLSSDSTAPKSVDPIIGSAVSTDYTTSLENVYFSNDSKVQYKDAEGTEGTISTQYDAAISVDTTTITDQQAYATYKAEDSSFKLNVVDGSWVARYQDVPAIRSLVDDSELTYDVAWYEGQNATKVITNRDEFYGFMMLSSVAEENFDGETISLGANIRANAGKVTDESAELYTWTPIGQSTSFAGTFDGKGKTISGVYLPTEVAESGLFGNVDVDGVVRNFTMKNSSIRGKGKTGGVVGQLQGTVQNVYVDSTVTITSTSTAAAVGGIVGMYSGSTEKAIENCWFAGTVTGGTRCGGIVGRMYEGDKTLKNCLNTGDISGTQHVGGLIGSVYGRNDDNKVTVTLRDCLNTGSATATTEGKFGNIIGDSATYVATITMENVYTTLDEGEVALGDGSVNADLTMNGTTIVLSSDTFSTGEGYIYPEFDFYSDTNKDGVWTVSQIGMPELKAFSTGSAYDSFKGPKKTVGWYYNQYTNVTDGAPTATSKIQDATSFDIKTPEDMFGLAELVNAKVEYFAGHKVKLNNDIVFNDAEAGDAKKWYNKTKDVPEISWTPIGSTDATKFQGEFYGQGNTISGLYVNNEEESSVATGLFGYTAGCTIQDVRLENSYLVDDGATGWAYLGSVIGWGHGTLNNVYSDAILYSTGRRVGGLVGQGGYNKGTTNMLKLNSCWYDGFMKLDYEGSARLESGGMVGYAYYGAVTADTCLFTGTIQCGYNYTGTASSYGVRIGGICGTDTNNCTLSVSSTISAGVIEVVGENNAVSLPQIQGIVGYFNNSASEAETEVYNLTKSSITVADKTTIVDDTTDCLLEGKAAYVWTNLLFENKDQGTYLWSAREGKVPAPAALVSEEDKLDLTNVTRPDTDIADNATGSEEDPYLIDSLEEFYGFIKLSQNDTFEGEYIQLTIDIVVDAKVYPIGSSEMPFAGHFDGDGHTISGVSMKADMDYMGLFAVVDSGATVRDFRLTNSEFYQLATSGVGYVGSIAGECRGTIDSVYSNAKIESTNTRAGGIVGQTSGTATITNCWFDGEITMTGEKDPETAGGIIGAADVGTTTLTNCLFTGVVDASYNVGGFCGLVDTSENNTLNIKSSISAGTLTNPKMSGRTGSVVGRVQNGFTKSTVDEVTTYTACQTFMNLENVFVTRDCYAMSVPYVDGEDTAADGVTVVAASEVTGHVVQTLNSDRLIGYCTEEAIEGEDVGASLDFTSDSPAWIIRTSGVPVPSCFADFEEKVIQVDVSTLDTVLGLSDLELSLTAAVHKGLGNYVVSKTATYNEYTGYLETLETLDFEKYVDNAGMSEDETTCADDSVYNAIYLSKDADEDGVRDSDWVITVTHAKTADDTYTMYISISTGGEASLSTNLISAEQVGTAAVTLHMPKLEYTLTTTTDDVTTEYYQYGNSFVFQLPNGHFIINDGGHEVELEYLLTYLNELADTAGTDAIYIDAWTVSHQHGDHFSLMKEYYEVVEAFEKGTDAEKEEVAWFGNIKDIYVEGFYINEPNMKVVSLESNSFYLVLERQHKGVSLFKQKSGAASQVFRYQTGQRYYFNGLVMDVIQAQEQLTTDSYKGDTDWYNATSTTLLFTVNATGDKIYIGGDATTVNDNYIMTAYGAESQMLSGIDVFVATHHGKNSTETYLNYLTDNGTDKFRTVLFPCSLVYGLEEGISNGSATMPDNNIYSGAQKANQYLIDNLIQEGGSYYDYGAGTVVVTFNAETN